MLRFFEKNVISRIQPGAISGGLQYVYVILYDCFVGLSEEPCTSHLPASEDIAAAVSPSSSNSSVSADNDSLRQPEAEAEASTSETKDKAKTKRNRCFMCRKKVGLTGEYSLLIAINACITINILVTLVTITNMALSQKTWPNLV